MAPVVAVNECPAVAAGADALIDAARGGQAAELVRQADNGTPWYFQGTADTHWSSAMLDELKKVPASAFEAVDTSSLMISSGSMQVKSSP